MRGHEARQFTPEEEHMDERFQEQFGQVEELDFYGGTIEAVDISPEHPKTEVPTLVAPGWGESHRTFKAGLATLYGKDRRVLGMRHARHGGDVAPEEHLPIEEVRKAKAILHILNERGLERIDAIAHSEGGINVAIAASLHPEKFRNIVLVGPGGLIGTDRFPKLVGRFSRHGIRSTMRALLEPEARSAIAKEGAEALKYFASNPVRALKEASAISGADTRDMLKELREQGIGVAVIHGVDDPVFPMNKMQEAVDRGAVDGFYSVKGDHNDIYVHPDQFMALAEQALTDLEKRKEQSAA